MATELAKAYVQIVPSADGIEGSISSVLDGEAKNAGKSAGSGIASSIGKTIGPAITALGIGKIIGDTIANGVEFGTSMAKLGTIADTSQLSMEAMGDQIAKVSEELGISQSALAEGAYSVISATGDTAGAMDIVAQASKLATAGFTDTDSAVSVLTTSLNAYGLEADQVAHISDSLVTTQNLGVTTVAELASNMGRAIATASGYGVSLENLEAAYISTTKSGISTAESTTYLSSMMAELGKDGSKVASILEEKTGKSFGQLMNDGESLADVLSVVYDSVDGNSEAFMNLWGSQEAGKSANAIINQGLDTFNENLNLLETQTGTTQEAYEKMADTLQIKTQKMTNSLQNIGIKLFDAVAPAFNALADVGIKAIGGLSDAIDTLLDSEKRAKTFSKVFSAIIPESLRKNFDWLIKSAFPNFAEFLKTDGLDSFKNSMENVNGVFESAMKIISPVITAVGDFVTYGLATVVEYIKQVFIPGFELVVDIFTDISSAVYEGIAPAFEQISETCSEVFEEVYEVIAEWVLPTVHDFIDVIKELWEENQDKLTLLGDLFGEVFDAIGDTIAWLKDTLVTPLLDAIVGLCENADENLGGFKETAQDVFDLVGEKVQVVIDAFTAVKETIQEVVEDYVAPMVGEFVELVTQLWEENQDKITLVKEFFVVAFQRIQDVVGFVVEKIKWYFEKIWYPAFQFAVGFVRDNWGLIKDAFQGAIDVISGIFSFFTNLLKGDWEGCFESIKDILGGAWDYLSSVFNLIVELFGSIASKILEPVKRVFSDIGEAIWKPIEDAKELISGIIENIKGFFSGFKIELPKIKLPHFGIEPEGWKISDLLKGSIPKLGIEWYDKGGVFTGPQIIGVGEKRPEFVGALDDLRKIVKDESGSADTADKLERMIDMMAEFFPEFAKSKDVILDGNRLVSATAERMDEALGRIQRRKERFA